MRQGGFLSLGVSGYAIAALAIGLAVSLGVASCEAKAKRAAQADAARIQGEFDGFVAQVARQGKVAEEEKAAIEKRWKEILTDAKAQFRTDLARRDAALRRLRERPPTDPAGRPLPQLACSPSGADAPSGEPLPALPLADYRALEERAYDDALRLTRLQEWVRNTGHPVE